MINLCFLHMFYSVSKFSKNYEGKLKWSEGMQKKSIEYFKKIGLELLCISCALLLLTSLFSFISLAKSTNASGETDTNDKISTPLCSIITEASATEQIPIIIQLQNQNIPFNTKQGRSQIDDEQKNIMSYLNEAKARNKAQKIKSTHIVNSIATKVTPEIIASLAEMPEVSRIELDEVVSASREKASLSKTVNPSCSKHNNSWGIDKIEAPKVWKRGITGKGIIVAIVDSGIDATHPDLDDLDDNPHTKDPKVVGWIDYTDGSKYPYDDFGHGTQIAGTISGTGASGVNTGVAPGTKLIVAKVFDQYGSGYRSDVILAFEWAVNNGARIISFSGGVGSHNSSFTIAIDKIVAAGVIPVVSTGNNGPDSKTITCPGDEINSTTVGATDSSDLIDYFSSRGPVNLYRKQYIKPDISAPGVDITSTVPVNYGYAYEDVSGTSIAAPHVSGTVALMLEKNPTLKPSKIKSILESTAVDLGQAGKDNDYGAGRINAYRAVFYNPASFRCKL